MNTSGPLSNEGSVTITNDGEVNNAEAINSNASDFEKESVSVALEANELEKKSVPIGVAPKNETLHLALPHAFVDDDPSGVGNGGVQYRRSRPVSRAPSLLEAKSPGFINTRLVNYNRGVSYQPSMRSVSHSQYHSEPENIPPPSSEEEKLKTTKRYFASISAISYAIFLVIFGAIAFIGGAVEDYYPIPEIFLIFMLSVGFVYFCFLYIDIRLHIKKAKQAVKAQELRLQMFQEHMAAVEPHHLQQGSMHFGQQIPVSSLSVNPVQPVSHRYCFVSGRHGSLVYLKFGAAWFCFGLLTHSVLTLTYQIFYLAEDSQCSNLLLLTVEIMFPLYSLFILFFIFKYCNIIINTNVGLARLMLMHAIGTSLAFWIYTIVRETQDAINMKRLSKNETYIDGLSSVRIEKIEDNNDLFTFECPGPENLNTIYRNFAPYLYPFIIEFCILIVGIFYMIFANVNHCPKKLSAAGHGHDSHGSPHGMDSNHFTSLGSIPEEGIMPSNGGIVHHAPPSEVSDHCKNLVEHENQYKSNLVVYADCHAASRGLFAGMVLMILTIVFIILLHVAVNEPNYIQTGLLVDGIFEVTVLVIMIVGVCGAYFQTAKLDINHHPISKLDDVLLFIAIPAFFSETIFSLVPAIKNGSILNILIIVAQIVQVLIQTPWIIDALRRCSNSFELRKKKPGREIVTFLTIANVSLWVYYTFSVKNADTQDERYYYYGDVLWSILNHLSLPLIMFYRFHSSVCLVDIWRHSYEPGEFAH